MLQWHYFDDVCLHIFHITDADGIYIEMGLKKITINLKRLQRFDSILNLMQELGDVMCALIPFLTTTAILASTMALACLAIDRFLFTTKTKLSFKFTKKGLFNTNHFFCTTSVIVIWGLAIGKLIDRVVISLLWDKNFIFVNKFAGLSSPIITSYFIKDFYIVFTDSNNQSIPIYTEEAQFCASDKVNHVWMKLIQTKLQFIFMF